MILILSLMLVGCIKRSYTEQNIDGIRFVSNHFELDKDFKIDLKKIKEYNIKEIIPDSLMVYSIYDVEMNKDGRIFIMDNNRYCVHMIDKDGNYIGNFGRKGIGPFEFSSSGELGLINEKVFVTTSEQLKSFLFDYNGNPVNEVIHSKFQETPSNFIISNGIVLSFYFGLLFDKPTSTIFQEKYISVFDDNLNFIKNISEKKIDTSKNKLNYGSNGDQVCYDSKGFYHMSKESFTNYDFEKYNSDMSKIEVISKKCKVIPFSKEYIESVKDELDGVFKSEIKNKQLVKNILVDKYDRIWVRPALEDSDKRKNVYDIFENGIFINQITLNADFDNFEFKDDFVLGFDNENLTITVYDY
ncbi:MAG: hypothetical protein JW870_11720 [Candidatus Delongbacteria bacterium]|nr:hypothetical protein [Candidatus Delongbacteria bacterium]